MARTAAQKLEALLTAATKLIDDVPGETRTATMFAAGKALDTYADLNTAELQWHLYHYDITGEVTDDLRAGLKLAAALLTNLDLEID